LHYRCLIKCLSEFFFGLLMMKFVRNMFVNVDYSYFDCNLIVYGLKWHCQNLSVVVEFLEMLLNCPYENVSLNFCFLKCCADMSQMPDRVRLGRQQSSTSSAWREKQAVHSPLAGWRRGGARELVGLMMRGDHRHRRVHPRRWTRHSISMSSIIIINIIRRRRITVRILHSMLWNCYKIFSQW
jgi:hypothetical protein